MIVSAKQRVFLAGGAGLAGTHIAKALVERSPLTEVRATFRHSASNFTHERVEYVRAEMESLEECRQAAQGCDVAILAVSANTGGAGALTTDQWSQVNGNVVMNIRLLEALHSVGIRRAICISSITAYQDFDGAIREDQLDMNVDPPTAHFGVGWANRFIEKLSEFWHRQSGIEIAVVRAANIFGPYAKFNPNSSNFIPALIRKAVAQHNPFEVWGSPDVTRDVIYAEDFAAAICSLVESDSLSYDIFNVGSGVRTTVGDVVQWSLKAAHYQPEQVIYRSDRPTTIQYRALDCSKIQNKTGWRPRFTIEEGVAKTTNWWIENQHWWTR